MGRIVTFAALTAAAAFCSMATAEQSGMLTGSQFVESYREVEEEGRQEVESQVFAVTTGIIAADAKIGGGLLCAHGTLIGETLMAIFQIHLIAKPEDGGLPWPSALLEAVVARYPCQPRKL
jgi:hypothetical protein